MLKKLFTIGMLACTMFVFSANSAKAQNDNSYAPEYPRYGFWSNWSVGGELLFDMQYGGDSFWRKTANAGLGVVFEKELNHVWATRLHIVVPGLWKPLSNGVQNGYDRLGKLGVDFKYSINNAIKGYDPDRRFSVYLLAGAGFTTVYVDAYVGMYEQAGVGMSLKCCKSSTLFLEYTHAALGDFHNFFRKGGWEDWEGTFALGWMHNFGPTAADQEMLAQAAALTQENFDAQNSELEGLRKDLNEAKRKEQRLINRINELEANQNNTIVKADDGVADSLRKVIEGYETNKHNFYAMPFSILYGIDQYTVSGDQMGKVKAIADIMKDNEDCNFEIIGYCDYSGSDAYNQKLSEKRAENVKKLLVNKYGIDEDRLTTSGKGKSMSFGDIKNAINRRVSFYRVNK